MPPRDAKDKIRVEARKMGGGVCIRTVQTTLFLDQFLSLTEARLLKKQIEKAIKQVEQQEANP